MGDAEEFREALLDLEKARQREANQRQTAEALLKGLHVVVTTTNVGNLFPQVHEGQVVLVVDDQADQRRISWT